MAKDLTLNFTLRKSFNHYLENQQSFVETYNGKVIVLVDYELVGVYDSIPEAYYESLKKYTPGTFLIQKVSPGTTDTVVSTYSSLSLSKVAA